MSEAKYEARRDDDYGNAYFYLNGKPTKAWIATAQVDAVKSMLQAERDEELGRWRDPKLSNYVVYKNTKLGKYIVLDETAPEIFTFDIDRDYNLSLYCKVGEVLQRYLDAHKPPRQPWHDAKHGEIWLLTFTDQFTDETHTIPAQVLTSGKFLPCQQSGHQPCAIPLDSHRIVDAKQLWTPNQNNEDSGYETVLSR